MGTGKEIENRGHIVGFREEISKVAVSNDDDFFTWFDLSKDKDAAFVRGSWDFTIHVALPAAHFLFKTEDKVALEIGHGGGRILAAASRHFKNVIGIDIHDCNQKVELELKQRGISNFRLIQTDGKELPLEDSSVDFVYSFIVLMHIEKYDIFKEYLNETSRVLKANSIAVVYFGRKWLLSSNKSSRFLYLIDKFLERILLPKGFKELPARVNEINLLVSLSHAKSLARKSGFEVLADLVSHKKVPDGVHLFGVQNGLVLRKK
jgi:ubiquinone/menaquinone biosynthesis C-methylase UbiE